MTLAQSFTRGYHALQLTPAAPGQLSVASSEDRPVAGTVARTVEKTAKVTVKYDKDDPERVIIPGHLRG
jgi:hypothetical protein